MTIVGRSQLTIVLKVTLPGVILYGTNNIIDKGDSEYGNDNKRRVVR